MIFSKNLIFSNFGGENQFKQFFQVSAARSWYKRHEESGNLQPLPRTGRPRVLTPEDEVDIIHRINENPFLTAKSFAREFEVDPGVIRSLFLRHGIKCRTAATVLRLTEEHRINRLAFCELLEQWDDDRLESIVFSDEKTFNTDVSRRSYVYRPNKTRYERKFTKIKDKSGHITNNYWGAIGIEGPLTPLVTINGPFNSARYIRILRTHIVPMMDVFQNAGIPRIFMQVNI